jgi:hypothetical protein
MVSFKWFRYKERSGVRTFRHGKFGIILIELDNTLCICDLGVLKTIAEFSYNGIELVN